ncbi:NapC/NirT family cytochrome c [Neobacillus sp. PS2-9]|uniref:cytochrome c3 family protein n=1 Tax=Neobacillus sp. PS2-9 TaxID=3070676 RepID=UPI0027DFE63C|nr:NapC/NirT family cytochrome c [Neobacillus sp. PS2-9]WML59058.1 NapC/NirT family cytochrome c [Neobacillus sp. PS2-9]
MEEEHKEELTAPPKFRYKLIKIATLTVLVLALFIIVGGLGLKATSSSEFCASCHEMKPQYYTWKASSHSEVECVNCHIGPGAENIVKAKGNGLVEFYKKEKDTYIAPIKMPNLIPDEACESCHNMKYRDVTPSGDIIIPHTKHKTEGIKCVQCHSGTAHGKISDRKVTYKSDYGKWDEKLGSSLMNDKKFTSPQMDTCMECHEARKATLECKACHETTMVPKNHKTEEFKSGGHGKIQPSNLKKCEQCHSYMSTEKYDLFKEDPVYQRFLNGDTKNSTKVTVAQFAKTNSFCKECHGTKPNSHKISSFMTEHGRLSKDTQKCFTCHDNRNVSDSPVTTVQCASCHPSSHRDTWRDRHPFKVPENQKYNKTCLKCHVEKTCNRCHKTNSKQ